MPVAGEPNLDRFPHNTTWYGAVKRGPNDEAGAWPPRWRSSARTLRTSGHFGAEVALGAKVVELSIDGDHSPHVAFPGPVLVDGSVRVVGNDGELATPWGVLTRRSRR